MDYNNLINRTFSSFFLIIVFFLLINFLDIYIPYILIFIYGFILYEIFFYINNKKNIYFLLILYLIISFFCSELYFIFFYEKILFLYFILLIICFDTFSYVFGSLYGKKKLIPNISPNKTIFGFVSGILFTLIISLVFNNFFHIFTFLTSLFFTILIILFAFIGDVIESFYKRRYNIINSSNILPGHGGIFDRMDSFVMSSIVMLIFIYFV